MRKTFLYFIVISGLLLVAVGIAGMVTPGNRNKLTANRETDSNTAGVSVSRVLQAHNRRIDREWPKFTQKGTLKYYTNFPSGSERLFERKLSFSANGPVVRYDRATLEINQSFLFDGNTLVQTTSAVGTKPEVKTLDGVDAASIKFQMATFGLLPVLKRLSDAGTQVVYVGDTSKGSRFQVTTVNGSWYFYSNANHLIDRLEIGEINITYGDYRTVDGLTLPFYQNIRKGDRILYEIRLEMFELSPVFDSGFFKS